MHMFLISRFLKTIVLSSLLIISAYKAQAQFDDELQAKKNCFKFTPQGFFVSTFMLSYERYIASGISLQITGGLLSAQKNYDTNYNGTAYKDKDKASGGLVEGMLKYYFLRGRSHMSGLYAGPYYKYSKNDFVINRDGTSTYDPITSQYTSMPPSQMKYSITTGEFGAVFGYQVVIKNSFVMDMFVGGGVKSSDNNSPATYTDERFWILESQDYSGVVPKAGFRLGFVF